MAFNTKIILVHTLFYFFTDFFEKFNYIFLFPNLYELKCLTILPTNLALNLEERKCSINPDVEHKVLNSEVKTYIFRLVKYILFDDI